MATSMPALGRAYAINTLPPFPAVAQKLMAIMGREDAPFGEIVKTIRTDAAFSAQALRLANSALIGSRAEISSILHALAIMGMERLKVLVITVAVRTCLGSKMSAAALEKCWRHNLATALFSDEMAQTCGLNPNDAYTAGLMHDIGRMALLAAYPNEYAALLSEAQAKGLEDIRSLERSRFDVDHCQAGAFLAAKWNFPVRNQEIIAHHHDSLGESFDLRSLVWASCKGARMMGFQSYGANEDWVTDDLLALLPPAAAERRQFFDSLPEKIAERLNAAECMLG
jgi:putative nucleotidyltransferase with HDIG domain